MFRSLLAASLMAVSSYSMAGSFLYDFTDVGYVKTKSDFVETSGYSIHSQFQFFRNAYAFFDVDLQSSDEDVFIGGSFEEVKAGSRNLGLGFYVPITHRADVYFNYLKGRETVSIPDNEIESSYTQQQLGFRFLATPSIEINPILNRYIFEDDVVEVNPGVSLRLHYQLISFGVEYESTENFDQLRASIRFSI